MATGGSAPVKGDSSTEAYEENMEANSGACVADYWAMPGVNQSALDCRGVGGQRLREAFSENLLEKRIRKLEHTLRKKEARESRGKARRVGKTRKRAF